MRRHIALLVALAACAHAPEQNGPPWYGDLHALAAEAARLRNTQPPADFDVIELDDAAVETTVAADELQAAALRAR
jgi:hypothetical protein